MPRLKPKGVKKMLKLNSLAELSKVADVPEAAFAPEPKLEVPEGAFSSAKPLFGEYAAYVKYAKNNASGHEYATFVFLKSTMKRYFKNHKAGDRYEFVQGKAPHKDWFVIRKAALKRGNQLVGHGLLFHSKAYVAPEKIDKTAKYPMELVFKDGALYAKLPAELVPLLR